MWKVRFKFFVYGLFLRHISSDICHWSSQRLWDFNKSGLGSMLKLFLPHKDWLPQSLQQKYFREHVKNSSSLTKIGYHNHFNKSILGSTVKTLPSSQRLGTTIISTKSILGSTLKLFLPHKDWIPQSFQQKYFREHVKTLPSLQRLDTTIISAKVF